MRNYPRVISKTPKLGTKPRDYGVQLRANFWAQLTPIQHPINWELNVWFMGISPKNPGGCLNPKSKYYLLGRFYLIPGYISEKSGSLPQIFVRVFQQLLSAVCVLILSKMVEIREKQTEKYQIHKRYWNCGPYNLDLLSWVSRRSSRFETRS